MYNKIDINSINVGKLDEVVLTTQDRKFYHMALEDNVFWPKNNFRPSQYVAYYFTDNCPNYRKKLTHIAKVKYMFHNVTIDEVLTSIPEFQELPNFSRFKQRA